MTGRTPLTLADCIQDSRVRIRPEHLNLISEQVNESVEYLRRTKIHILGVYVRHNVVEIFGHREFTHGIWACIIEPDRLYAAYTGAIPRCDW